MRPEPLEPVARSRGSASHALLAMGAGSLLLVCLAGCATVQTQRPATNPTPAANSNAYHHVPKIHIATWKKFSPIFWFGNADDPRPPDSYRPGQRLRVCLWYFRNPCHNFMFYVIGITDKEFVRVGTYPRKTLNPEGGWAWAVCRYKWLRLPCTSYKGKRLDFYLGWRNRGNFGIALRWERRE